MDLISINALSEQDKCLIYKALLGLIRVNLGEEGISVESIEIVERTLPERLRSEFLNALQEFLMP